MPAFICTTCGTQHADSDRAPEHCAICEDERQFVGWKGQRWTTIDELRATHRNEIRPEGPGLIGIGTEPAFAIGQRALLVPHATLPMLWDCVPLVDEASVAAVLAGGGARAIAISHPHYYSAMIEWSRALGGVPVYLHEADRAWVMRPDPVIRYWSGDALPLADGLTLLRLGGHFEGATVLHWAQGFGEGALLTGDVIQVCDDRRWVSFMYSYPNLIPLDPDTVRRIVDSVESYAFDALCGAWWNKVIPSGAKQAVRRSAERYIEHILRR